MTHDPVQTQQLSQVISQATAPSFGLGAVSGLVAVLMGRMNGVIDRIRAVNAIDNDDEARAHLKADLPRLRRRARLMNDTTANMLIQALAGTYRVGTWQLAETGAGPLAVTVDPYAGNRYTYLDTELKGKLDLPTLGVDARRQVEGDEHWADPIVGLRTA